MKKIILSEEKEKLLFEKLLNEKRFPMSKEDEVLSYLKANYVIYSIPKVVNGQVQDSYSVMRLYKGQPMTDNRLTFKEVFEELESKYRNLYSDPKRTENELKEIMNDWYYKVKKHG